MKRIICKKLKALLPIQLIAIVILISSCSKDAIIETLDTIEDAIVTEANLDNLNGEWIRIASNNVGSDGMIINMSGTAGKLTNKAGSGFQVDDLKWKDIKVVDAENYDYQELGSDYNYYAAKMVLKADDTLRITVGSSGAGNIQKWVREGEYIPIDSQGPDSTENLPCTITEARTLVNGSADIDYFIDCVLDITAPLTIEPGTVIQFGENAGLGVYNDGSLNAVGSTTEPIIFKGATAIDGYWRGIHIETRSINNKLENLSIQDAGSNYVYCCNGKASLFLKGAKVALSNLNISNGRGVGLMVINDTEFDEYNNIRIETHKDYPVHIESQGLSYLDGPDSDYSGNDKNYVFVSGMNINKPTTWKKMNIPYLFEGKVLDITNALTIEAGVEIVMQENGGLGVYDEGSLTVNGLENEPVIIRGETSVQGFWRGIHMESNKLENKLNYLQVSDAGSNYVYCCNDPASLLLKDGIASITNSTFSNGKGRGIVTRPNFEFISYQGNTITSHEQAPLYIDAETMGALDGQKSTYKGNDKDVLLIYHSDIDEEITVKANDVPFRIENGAVIDIVARLNLLPGVEMEFEENAGMGVYDNGILNAVGSSEKKIIFRGTDDIVGFWRGIHTETNSLSNIIRYAEISNAGSNYIYCCNDKASIFIKAGQMTVENSLISQSAGCGIHVNANAKLTESGNDYSNNTDGDLCN